MGTDEKELKGEELQQVFLEQRDRLFAFILAIVHNFSDAEDLFQEVARVILRKQQEAIVVRRFGAWSREIARRTVQDHFKTRKKSRLVLAGDAFDALEAAFAAHEDEPAAEDNRLLQRLRTCLAQLPEHLRRLVGLRYEQNLSLKDISARVGRTSGAIQVALSRTRGRLFECTKRLQLEREGAL